ncbi:actin-binding protein IPP [Lingula anatina]|uniref:Actin-binding protein IPP n=1 Tax=Lingula anatina TaxID=7574 RepID=A0A1S3I230_LINAN|nr:actin-binding protein IPP [Lingula anatina]|eukprot:XP_013391404.1 actin-binding protein IPP [Lingula anatina]
MSTKDHLNFKSPNHAEDLLKKLQELWRNGRFCDVQLAVQEKQFSAHRNVLSACSPYFQAMFAGGLAEEGMAKVELHEVDLEIFSILLDFMYTGEVDVRNDNCQDLLAAADMFGLPEVMTACCEFMKQQIHPSNCLGIYDFADAHACQDLKKYTEKYIHKHFLDVVKEEEFFLLPKETVIKIFQSEELRIENEFQVFSAAMDWINHDIKARRPSVFDVLNPVRLSIISPAQLEKHIIMCEDLSLKVALRKIIQDIKTDRDITSFGLKPHKLNYYQKHHVQPRRCARKMIYVIGGFSRLPGGRWSDSQTLNTVECFDSFRQQWKTVPSIKFCRSGHGVTVLDGNIYVIGGESDSLIFDTAEHLDPVSNHWSMLPSMTVPRCGLGVCTVDDFIYALGGWVGSEIGDTIECYNPTLNVWSKVGKLVTLRFAMGVVEHEGKHIYVLLDFLCLTEFTVVFEILQPSRQHVEDLSYLKRSKLQFIAWTSCNLEATEDKQLCSMPPDIAIQIAEALGLPSVDYTVIPASDVDNRMLQVRQGYGYEGEVFYFLDSTRSVMGLLKKKTIWYIVCRAIREKSRSTCQQNNKSPSTFSLSKALNKTERRIDEIQKWLNLDNGSVKLWKDLGTKFVRWCVGGVDRGNITVADVADLFPVLWKRYLEESHLTDKVHSSWTELSASDT